VVQSKTVEVRITKFSPYGSPISLVLKDKFHPEILMGSPERASNEGGVEKQALSSFIRQYLENSRRYGQNYYKSVIGSRIIMRF